MSRGRVLLQAKTKPSDVAAVLKHVCSTAFEGKVQPSEPSQSTGTTWWRVGIAQAAFEVVVCFTPPYKIELLHGESVWALWAMSKLMEAFEDSGRAWCEDRADTKPGWPIDLTFREFIAAGAPRNKRQSELFPKDYVGFVMEGVPAQLRDM